MFELKLEGAKELRRFAEVDFKNRQKAIQKMILRDVVESVYEEVAKAIPVNEPWLKAYKDGLKVYEVTDMPKGEIGFAIASQVSGEWGMVDAHKMIVYFETTTISPDAHIGEIMAKFSPFTVDKVPNLKAYGARPIIRRVRVDEIEDTRKKNASERASLSAALAEEGISIESGPAKISGKVYFDMSFAVMRMELGFGEIRKPHWRPALKKISIHLNAMARNPKVLNRLRGLLDPANDNWKGALRPEHPPLRLREIGQFADFQGKLTIGGF